MTLLERLEEEIRKGEEEARETGVLPSTWLRFFGFETNPFDRSPLDPVTTPSDIEKIVNLDDLMKELARLVGLAASGEIGHRYGIIGADGMGKRSIGRAVCFLAHSHGYHTILHSTSRRTVVYPEGYEPGEYPEPPDDDWDIMILEENRPTEKATSNMRLFEGRGILMISTWRPEEINHSVQFDREVHLTPLTLSDIVQLLKTRILSAGGSSTDITEKALETIASKSWKLPGLSLQLAEVSFDWAFRRKRKPVTEKEVLEATQRYGFDLPGKLSLSTKDREVARFLLQDRQPNRPRTVTARNLTDELGVDRVLAWRYLERLRRKKILQKTYHGKAGHYELTGAAAVLLQLELGSWRS